MNLEKAIQKIHWLGHDAFRLDGTKVVYFDPFQMESSQAADIILISHEHFDHCSPEDVAKVQKDDTVIVANAASARKLSGDIRVVAPGEQVEVCGVQIDALPAYNMDKDFHPYHAGMLSFVVTLDGVRYFHAGDTDFIPEMESVRVDVAFLPVSGTYVMTAEQAARAARAIRPKVAIPMHYGSVVGTEEDARKFEELVGNEIQVLILNQESS